MQEFIRLDAGHVMNLNVHGFVGLQNYEVQTSLQSSLKYDCRWHCMSGVVNLKQDKQWWRKGPKPRTALKMGARFLTNGRITVAHGQTKSYSCPGSTAAHIRAPPPLETKHSNNYNVQITIRTLNKLQAFHHSVDSLKLIINRCMLTLTNQTHNETRRFSA